MREAFKCVRRFEERRDIFKPLVPPSLSEQMIIALVNKKTEHFLKTRQHTSRKSSAENSWDGFVKDG